MRGHHGISAVITYHNVRQQHIKYYDNLGTRQCGFVAALLNSVVKSDEDDGEEGARGGGDGEGEENW